MQANNQLNKLLTLRRACALDKEIVFRWRNLDEIIALSTSKKTVTWDEHSTWFDCVLSSDSCVLLVVEQDNEPIGQVRFDKSESSGCSISVYLIPSEIGKGIGTFVIQEGCEIASCVWPTLRWVQASIQNTNERSIRSFTKAGFAPPEVNLSHEPENHTFLRWNTMTQGK